LLAPEELLEAEIGKALHQAAAGAVIADGGGDEVFEPAGYVEEFLAVGHANGDAEAEVLLAAGTLAAWFAAGTGHANETTTEDGLGM